MLSIGKLSHLAKMYEDKEREDGSLDGKECFFIHCCFLNFLVLAFHDGLDFISVHETLIQSLRTALESARGRQSLENQVEMIVKAKATSLVDRMSFLKV